MIDEWKKDRDERSPQALEGVSLATSERESGGPSNRRSRRGDGRLARGLELALSDPAVFGRAVLGRPPRRYQVEPARAILRSVLLGEGEAITVMFARQAGKNELSAQIECLLLNRASRSPGAQIVKAAPTFRPQIINSLIRLEGCLNNPLNRGRWRREHGYTLRLGEARMLFFSGSPASQVVGATANVLLEFDEAQDISEEKHTKDFLPMAATTNTTRVYYGTAWNDETLLAKMVARNRELEARDGKRRHFAVPWWVVAEELPSYGRYVEGERARLGESHPLFRTQYALETISGGGRFFSSGQVELLIGSHPRLRGRDDEDAVYVAGVDIAGEDESAADAVLRQIKPRKDSTVVTVARVRYSEISDSGSDAFSDPENNVFSGVSEPWLEVVDHYWWTGRDHRTQFEELLRLLRQTWRVSRVCVDGTGVGAGVGSFLHSALGSGVCEVVQFSAGRKSKLGYSLLSAVNSGRLKLYGELPQGEELAEFWREARACRYEVRANQSLGFFVPESEGHDDFIISAALCVSAAEGYGVAPAGVEVRARPLYSGERW